MSLRATLFVLLAVSIPLASLAQVTKTGNAYLFRMKLVKGSSQAYVMSTSTDMGTGKPLIVPMSYSMKVTNVVKGIADVAMSATTPMQKAPQTSTIKMDSRGAIDGQAGLEQLTGIRLPEKAIKVGETWKSAPKVGTGTQGMAMDSVYTFSGVQAVGKIQCAVLSVKSSGKGALTSSTTGKMYIELANGMLYQSNLVSSFTFAQNGKSTTYKSTITIKRK